MGDRLSRNALDYAELHFGGDLTAAVRFAVASTFDRESAESL
jgi:hypothetical protein